MGFPGAPYARQERHRAEMDERDRVLGLIRQLKEHKGGVDEDLEKLEQALRWGSRGLR